MCNDTQHVQAVEVGTHGLWAFVWSLGKQTIGEQIWQLLQGHISSAVGIDSHSTAAKLPRNENKRRGFYALSTISLCNAGCYAQRLFPHTHARAHTHTDSHTYPAGEANSQWLVLGAAPLSALNNTEAQVLRSARDLQVCQMASTCAYSIVRMPQMAAENG